MPREGGVVGLRDLGRVAVLGLVERLIAVGAGVLDSIGGCRVCAVFVVAAGVANTVIVDAAIGGAGVVVVQVAVGGGWGGGKLRSRLGCYEEMRDAAGLLPVILTISVVVHCVDGKINVQPRRPRQQGEGGAETGGDCLPDSLEVCERVCLVLELEILITVCVVVVEAREAAPLAVRDVGLGLVRLLRLLLAARVARPFRGVLGLELVAVCIDDGVYVPLGGHRAQKSVAKNTDAILGVTMRMAKNACDRGLR